MPEPDALSFDAEEIARVESFRRLKDTAVLTILFTDIEGFTELTDREGEHVSNDVRRRHDAVLESAITRGEAGIVVKHIGDAIMAVFSEPSTAVERAVEIQAGIDRLNREHPERAPLRVRIGLDMGQVTVEDRVAIDFFGRHVNRASRIESLARGGQVLLSYTVFDSARGWLAGSDLAWTSHGRYRLKGVSEPVEVFEVADRDAPTLAAPRGGERVRTVPRPGVAAALVLLGVAGTLGYMQLRRTEVYLTDYDIPRSWLDGTREVLLDGEPGQSSRRLLADVGPGRHVLHYDVARGVRYYAELQVERGENRLRPRWEESRLPSLYRHVGLGEAPVEARRSGRYFVYDPEGRRIDYEAELAIGLRVAPDPDRAEGLVATLSWRVDLNGSALAREERELRSSTASPNPLEERIELYSDPFHRYWVDVRLVKRFAHLEVSSAFERP